MFKYHFFLHVAFYTNSITPSTGLRLIQALYYLYTLHFSCWAMQLDSQSLRIYDEPRPHGENSYRDVASRLPPGGQRPKASWWKLASNTEIGIAVLPHGI